MGTQPNWLTKAFRKEFCDVLTKFGMFSDISENDSSQTRLKELLAALYGKELGGETWIQLLRSLEEFREGHPDLTGDSSESALDGLDALLITYPDQFQSPGQSHLNTLAVFFQDYLGDIISGVHILPFFPFSSDDGFSIIDYTEVDPVVGSWDDLNRIGNSSELMFDAVINHISSQSKWFQNYLLDIEPYIDYFLTTDPKADLSLVVRPRSAPLLSEVNTSSRTCRYR